MNPPDRCRCWNIGSETQAADAYLPPSLPGDKKVQKHVPGRLPEETLLAHTLKEHFTTPAKSVDALGMGKRRTMVMMLAASRSACPDLIVEIFADDLLYFPQ